MAHREVPKTKDSHHNNPCISALVILATDLPGVGISRTALVLALPVATAFCTLPTTNCGRREPAFLAKWVMGPVDSACALEPKRRSHSVRAPSISSWWSRATWVVRKLLQRSRCPVTPQGAPVHPLTQVTSGPSPHRCTSARERCSWSRPVGELLQREPVAVAEDLVGQLAVERIPVLLDAAWGELPQRPRTRLWIRPGDRRARSTRP